MISSLILRFKVQCIFMRARLLTVLFKSSIPLLSLSLRSHNSQLKDISLYDGRFITFCLPSVIFLNTSLAMLLHAKKKKKVKFPYNPHMNWKLLIQIKVFAPNSILSNIKIPFNSFILIGDSMLFILSSLGPYVLYDSLANYTYCI